MNNGTILVFGAHPDDVEIGMGGTIKKLSEKHKVITCIASLPNKTQTRKKETASAAQILGVETVRHLALSPHTFGFNRETIKKIDALIETYRPQNVFTHWIGDSHQDHTYLTQCVFAAARHNHFNVLMYEQAIPGGITHTTFRPQLFVDISFQLEDKIKSILAHKTQHKKYGDGWIQGVRGRAMHRGYQIKTVAAEAFEIVKIKEDLRLL
ncbi:MAG: hypothetical protein A3J54_01270 [Candidatus Ryanbacteria bacterium RIFCSPHIGHO2_02_FULL_45_13b]|uniref:GlcNAc-PI de-N-acetylase n=1 Tax=Candidatus Ryanbacteria bacterium RIFCSPHIGHO2_02_FULL_45_13b TaxID=1802117 RepID=A0A1G2GBE0_9BACT|nr:MAG: hypothetical protein A3J54_01270 [Candidatus Ryanbacteria bacterium RIFCSPHIGHO2_02_FULL_45_13b]